MIDQAERASRYNLVNRAGTWHEVFGTPQPTRNLNSLRIKNKDGADRTLEAPPVHEGGAVAYFRDLERHLIGHIARADLVVGCVAWMTNLAILRALATVPEGVSIIVQKEDFLRPDIDTPADWRSKLRQAYAALLPAPLRDSTSGLPIYDLSVQRNCYYEDPVRCAGNYNQNRKSAFPRMHNKFLVFCECRPIELIDELDVTIREWYTQVIPTSVWTGSFNLTENATLSLENAVLIKSPAIVQAYFEEWGRIFALSEQLDWESEWCTPEFHIGT